MLREENVDFVGLKRDGLSRLNRVVRARIAYPSRGGSRGLAPATA